MTQIEESKALSEFLKVLHNGVTRKQYHYYLDKYLEWTNRGTYDNLVTLTNEEIQTSLENYCTKLINNKHSRSYLKLTFSSLSLFYGMNNKLVNTLRIRKMINPNEEQKQKLQAYTTEDIQKLILAADKTKFKKAKPKNRLLNITVIHFLAASGVRFGSLPDIRLKDLEVIENCYSVKVYANSKYEYFTFLTPEASKVLSGYLKTRNLEKEEHRLRNPWTTKEEILKGDQLPIFPYSYNALRLGLNLLRKRADIKQTKVNGRYEKPVAHAFRYRFNTILKENSNINPTLAEVMMGHSLTIKLDEHYLKSKKEKLFEEYKKAIPELTLEK